jgi:hypothetical protein
MMIKTYGVGITRIPLNGEIGSLWSDDDGIIIWERTGCNCVAAESRIDVCSYRSALATVVVLSGEIVCVGTAKDILIIT